MAGGLPGNAAVDIVDGRIRLDRLTGVDHGYFHLPGIRAAHGYGVGTSVHFKPVHRLAAYRYLECHLPVTEQIGLRGGSERPVAGAVSWW
ncbi:hypothetical protein [Kitasatospora sp. NPDC005856]|uniref:hypothetical protein n=1 Tax=Kitasatospora sp. NPDC005856 TaxID=3154566 RepID=UPI0033DB70AC